MRVDPLFSDHAVLQRERGIRVFGTGEAGAEVVVTTPEQTIGEAVIAENAGLREPTTVGEKACQTIDAMSVALGQVGGMGVATTTTAGAVKTAKRDFSQGGRFEWTRENAGWDYELRNIEGEGRKVGPDAEARGQKTEDGDDVTTGHEKAISKQNPYRNEAGEIRLPRFEDLKLGEQYRKDWEEMRQIVANQALADKIYDAIPDSHGGKVIGTDVARELSPLFASGREGRIAFTPSTSRLASIYAQDRLWREIHKRGDREVLIFTAGGVASGKSTVMSRAAIQNADLVFDGTLRNASWAKSAIRDALSNGWEVSVEYVQRPLELVASGAVFRANDSGRWGPAHKLAETHKAAQDSIIKIYGEFRDDIRVDINFWINDGLTLDQPARRIEFSQIDKGGEYSYDESNGKNQDQGVAGKDGSGYSGSKSQDGGGVPEGARRVKEGFRREVESGDYETRILRRLADGDAEYEAIVEDYLKKRNQE